MREVVALSFVSFFKYAFVLDLAWFQFLFCTWHFRFYRTLLETNSWGSKFAIFGVFNFLIYNFCKWFFIVRRCKLWCFIFFCEYSVFISTTQSCKAVKMESIYANALPFGKYHWKMVYLAKYFKISTTINNWWNDCIIISQTIWLI